MGQLVLLVVAAAWAAVLLPPLLRSRIENRPNSSVTDFRNQLVSLQRAMPSRGVAMRSMARPLAPSPLSRPAAPGRPGLRTPTGAPVRLNGHTTHPAERRTRPEPVRSYDATPRARQHAEAPARSINPRDVARRRRANVLFVLALLTVSSLFLAATTGSQPMVWVAVGTIAALFGYVCLLGQLRQRALFDPAPARPAHREPPPARREAPPAPRPAATGPGGRVVRPRPAPAPARAAVVRRPADRWSHAV